AVLTGITDGSTLIASNSITTNSPQRDALATLFPALMPGPNPSITGSIAANKQSQVPQVNKTMVTKIPATTQSRWSYGFTAQVGMSGMNEGGMFNFKRASVVDLSGGIANSAFLPANTMIYKSSEITPEVGFTLGGYAQRSLNKRFDLS